MSFRWAAPRRTKGVNVDFWDQLGSSFQGLGNTILGVASGQFIGSQAPDIGTNPYQGDWQTLIQTLRDKAAGKGESVAGRDYMKANNDLMQQVAGLSHSGSAGATAAATGAAERLGENQVGGYARARAQEMAGAQDALTGALSGASSSWNQQQQLQLQKWAQQNQLDMNRLKAMSGLYGGLGSLFGGGGQGQDFVKITDDETNF